MSVYPEISVKQPPPVENPLTRFYFQSKSGKIAETLAENKTQSSFQYMDVVMPTPFLHHHNDFVCCFFSFWNETVECGGRHCPKRSHAPTSTGTLYNFELENYMNFFHNVTKKYPDFFSSGRFEAMYYETPSLSYGEWRTTFTDKHGKVWNRNPGKYIYTWKHANVTFETNRELNSPFYDFLLYVGKGGSKICCETILCNLYKFTDDHWDRLAGSLEPLTVRPPSPPETILRDEVRKPTPVRRRGGYEPISLTDTTI
jgi:hypothetical protein